VPIPADPVSTFTHFGGAIIFAIAGFSLLKQADPRSRRWSLGVFAVSGVLLLLASSAFHALPDGSDARAVAKRLDHAAIFVLIAGTFTPIQHILFKGVLRWGMLAFVWTAAIAGLTLKTVFFNEVPEAVGVSAYLALGWVGLFSVVVICKRWGIRFVSPMVLGGLAYTVGAMCEFTGQPTIITGLLASHEVFHVAVLVGLGCHWMFIRRLTARQATVRVRMHERSRSRERAASDPADKRAACAHQLRTRPTAQGPRTRGPDRSPIDGSGSNPGSAPA